ncbi:hypothetical protein F7725_004502 [Dissostichus mawsoni]|uniref:Uncharacterized protein n=1 Tax=Dissostichus mawsoni TaxID=36200 RepID=A0A7J5XLJ2_DISMA|nr:hypothetical protein F7725_004502 [Dissostichus mawsoni]
MQNHLSGKGVTHARLSPSSDWLAVRWLAASLSLSRRTMRCFSSSRCFSELPSSQRPSSIRRWSGRRRLSVGDMPSSYSFRVSAKEGLIDRLLFALGAVLSSEAALHHPGKLHLLVPRARQHVVGLAVLVHHYTCHLKKGGKEC